MSDDPIRDALRVADRPIAPDPRFHDALLERLFEEVEREGAAFPPRRLSPAVRGTLHRALVAAAVLAGIVAVFAVFLWPLRGWISRPPPASEVSSTPPFRATIMGSFPASQSDRAGDFELRVSYRGPGAWRIDVTAGDAAWQPLVNANVGGVGSYVLWDGVRLVAYDAGTDSFIPQPDHAAWFSPLNLLGFADGKSGWKEACASGSHLGSSMIVERPVQVLRCPAPASFSSRNAEVQLWVDIDSGLILKMVSSADSGQKFPPGPIAWYSGERIEVTSIEYDPAFGSGMFSMPPGAPTAPEEPAGKVTSLSIGQVVPSFAGETLDGSTFDLSDLRGTPTLAYIWAEWCQPCVDFPLDVLDRVFAARRDVNIVTIGASVEPPSIDAFVRGQGYQFPVVLPEDPRMKAWGIQGVPTLVLLDRKGRLVGAYSGWRSEVAGATDLEAIVEALVSGRPLPEVPGSSSQLGPLH